MPSTDNCYVIYTIPRCPWCSLLQEQFRSRKVAFRTIELRQGEERERFKAEHKVTHFPQAFTPAGEKIGNYNDTRAYLDDSSSIKQVKT